MRTALIGAVFDGMSAPATASASSQSTFETPPARRQNTGASAWGADSTAGEAQAATVRANATTRGTAEHQRTKLRRIAAV
jgi:hypothetical protein